MPFSRPQWLPHLLDISFPFPLILVVLLPFFCRSPFSPSFSCCRFRLFPVSTSSLFFAFLLFSLRCFPWSRILCTPHPRCLRASKAAYSPCVLSSLVPSYSLFLLFLIFLPLFDFDLDIVLCHPVFFLLWVSCCLLSFSSGGWVKIKLKLPHFHVSDTCRVSI